MNNKNIIFFMPLMEIGGVEKNLFIISNYLSKKYDNIYICTSSKKYQNRFNKKIKFLSPKINLKENLHKRLKYFYCLYLLCIFILNNKNSFVISFQANIYCVLLCKLLKINVAIRSNTAPTGWDHGFIKKILYKLIIKKADVVITNSIEFKKILKKKLNINSICIYNPLNKKDIVKQSKQKLNFNFFKKNKKVIKIINIGRLTEQKDQITILKAANILKKKKKIFKLLILGDGTEKQNLKNYIESNNLSKNVRLIKAQKNPFYLIKNSDVFILSSKYEGLPNVLLEAAVLKKLIISTACPTGPKEILMNGKGGLMYKTGDFEDLAKQIIYFINNKKKINNKVNYAYKNLNRFDYQKNLEKYFKIIKKYSS